jgi:hypothetical protein
MNMFLLFPTMRCNLRCSYCHFRVEKDAKSYKWNGYGKEHVIKEEVPWHELAMFLNRHRPYHAEFSGGEPTIYRGFKDLVNATPPDSQWAVTSNTIADVQGIDFSRCKHWTASYHEHNFKDQFDTNINYLLGRVPMSVSMVVPFTKVQEVVDRAFVYQARGFRVNLLRELNPGVDWRGTEEWAVLEGLRGKGFLVVEEDIPDNYHFERGFLCVAGHSYFAIMPDGNVYRCYSDAMKRSPIGTIWEFEKFSEARPCWDECLGCAMDHKARLMKLEREHVTG